MSRWYAVATVFLLLVGACSPKGKVVFVQAAEVQLSAPVIDVEAVFFYDSTRVFIKQPPAPCRTFYAGGKVAGDEMLITESSLMRFKNMGCDHIASEELEVEVFKIKPEFAKVKRASAAKEPYANSAPDILTDHQKASKNFREDAWLGYQDEVLTFELENNGRALEGITLSILEDQGSWIFAPLQIEASFYKGEELILQAQTSYDAGLVREGSSFRFLKIPTQQISPSKIEIKITNLPGLPEWHPGHGHQPWLFIDEIILL